MNKIILQISELNKLISDHINHLEEFEVEAEISDWRLFGGKLFYFKLKDKKSSVSAMTNIFELTNWRDFEDGMLVRAKISIKFNQLKGTLYAWVEEMNPHGEGALKIAFEKLRKRLETEGLFSQERKRHIVRYPQRLGLITSKDGAAIKDFEKILNSRMGGLTIYFHPVKVEGKDAVPSIIEAFSYFNNFKESLDAIVLIRGGGSLENLQVFNDERIARCVAGSRYPVICGVGHEHDVSLCDLCADVRASTPSNAAELLVENKVHTQKIIDTSLDKIRGIIKFKIGGTSQQIESHLLLISHSIKNELQSKKLIVIEINSSLFRYKSQFSNFEQQISQSVVSISRVFVHRLDISKQYLAQTAVFLKSVSPKNIMAMGYSVVKDEKQKIVRDSEQLEIESNLCAYFLKGSIKAKVIKKGV